MRISRDSTAQEILTVNGEEDYSLDKIVKNHNDSFMTFSYGAYQYQVKYHFDQVKLTLVFENYDKKE